MELLLDLAHLPCALRCTWPKKKRAEQIRPQMHSETRAAGTHKTAAKSKEKYSKINKKMSVLYENKRQCLDVLRDVTYVANSR